MQISNFKTWALTASMILISNYGNAQTLPTMEPLKIYNKYKSLSISSVSDLQSASRVGLCYIPKEQKNVNSSGLDGYRVKAVVLSMARSDCRIFNLERATHSDPGSVCVDNELRATIVDMDQWGNNGRSYAYLNNPQQAFSRYAKEPGFSVASLVDTQNQAMTNSRFDFIGLSHDQVISQLVTVASGDTMFKPASPRIEQGAWDRNTGKWIGLQGWPFYSKQISGQQAEFFRTSKIYRSSYNTHDGPKYYGKAEEYQNIERIRLKKDTNGDLYANITSRMMSDLAGGSYLERFKKFHQVSETDLQFYCHFPNP